jgi:serine protease Do
VLIGSLLSGLIGSGLTVVALWLGGVFDEEPVPTAQPDATMPVVEVIDQQPAGPAQISITPSDIESRVAAVAAKVIPSIVTVEVGDIVSFTRDDEDIEQFQAFGSGSGVVFRDDGFILTNNHVVEDAAITKVIFFDGRTYDAEVVGTDPLTDIAVIKIAASDLVPIEFADIDELDIGDQAIAIGNPLGLAGGPSVTAGVISAFNRSLQTGPNPNDRLHGLLQTDAPITRGSSGGALLDEAGRLIGITTAIGVSDVGAEGLAFAVPVDLVQRLASDLMEDGVVQHAYLGINIGDALAQTDDGAEVPIGAEVTGLQDTSAMAEAGAQEGDIIISIEGQDVLTAEDLLAVLRSFRAGDTIEILIDRDGEEVVIEVELDLRPDNL